MRPLPARQRRTERGDPAHAGQDVRQLRRLAAIDRDAVDVGDALAIGQEIERPPVLRPLRMMFFAPSNPPASRTCPDATSMIASRQLPAARLRQTSSRSDRC